MIQKTISRRNFLLGAATLTATLLASCSGPDKNVPSSPSKQATATVATPNPTQQPTAESTQASVPTPTVPPSPTPTPEPEIVNVWVNPSNPARFKTATNQLLARIAAQGSAQPIQVDQVTSQDQANVSITTLASGKAADTVTLASVTLVPVCSPRTPILDATKDQVAALLAGTAKDWSSAGSPTSIAVEPFVIDGIVFPGTAPGATKVASYDDFVARLTDHPGAIALAAVDDVDFRASSLTVDGVDVMSVPEIPKDWPFKLDLYVTSQPNAWHFIQSAMETSSPDSVVNTNPPLTVTFVGDVILGRTVHTIMTRLNDYSAPFRLVADELKKTDITIANLECSLSDDITPPTDPYTFSFMTYTAGGDGLVLSGVDAVSQANNHSMNFGVQGMRDTLAALDKRNIQHFGIGENLAEARKPVILESHGRKVAFLGYDRITGTTYGATDSTAGTSPLNLDIVTEDIAAARQSADLVIPFFHWGIEYKLVPDADQRAAARKAIDAGADMVIGSHCHWVQGMETYQGKPIIYSLANFVFDQDWSLETKQGLIMHLVFRETRLAAIRFVPVLIENFYRPRIVDGTQKTQILDRIWESTDILLSSQ